MAVEVAAVVVPDGEAYVVVVVQGCNLQMEAFLDEIASLIPSFPAGLDTAEEVALLDFPLHSDLDIPCEVVGNLLESFDYNAVLVVYNWHHHSNFAYYWNRPFPLTAPLSTYCPYYYTHIVQMPELVGPCSSHNPHSYLKQHWMDGSVLLCLHIHCGFGDTWPVKMGPYG